jgi:hypothetical protein
MNLYKGVATKRGGREMPIELLRSWQLLRKKRERGVISLDKLNGGEGGGDFSGLAHHSCQSTDHNENSYFRLDT